MLVKLVCSGCSPCAARTRRSMHRVWIIARCGRARALVRPHERSVQLRDRPPEARAPRSAGGGLGRGNGTAMVLLHHGTLWPRYLEGEPRFVRQWPHFRWSSRCAWCTARVRRLVRAPNESALGYRVPRMHSETAIKQTNIRKVTAYGVNDEAGANNGFQLKLSRQHFAACVGGCDP